MLLIPDGSSSKDPEFPRIPWDVPPKFSNLKESLKSQSGSSVFKIKAEKRRTKAQPVISAPVRWVLFLMDHCLRISLTILLTVLLKKKKSQLV